MPNAPIRPPADAWNNILPSEVEALDANLTAGINGDDGSTHAPASPIDIGGTQGLVVTGPVLVERGGAIFGPDDLTSSIAPTLNLLDGDWGVLDPSNVLTVRTPMQSMLPGRGIPSYTWVARPENASLQALSPMFDLLDGNGPQVSRAYVPLVTHDGATLASLSIFFHVGATHTNLPAVMPSARLVRQDLLGNTVAMTSVAAGANLAGYVFAPTPTSAAAWTAGFATQELTIPVDQFNVIDESQYAYFVEVVEEQGLTGYPWALSYYPTLAIVATTGNLPTLTNLPFVDGVDLSTGAVGHGGDLVLVKEQANPLQNGLFFDAVGDWLRVTFFAQGMIVRVVAGDTNAGTLWQANALIASWTPTPPPSVVSWAPGVAWKVGDQIIPGAAQPNGFYYRCTIAGTGSAGTPAFTTTIGATFSDGAATFVCYGLSQVDSDAQGQPINFVEETGQSYPAEGSALFGHGISWHGMQATFTQIPDLRPE